MRFTNRKKKYASTDSTDITKKTFAGIDETVLNTYCSFAMSQNANIRMSNLKNMNKLVGLWGQSLFDKNQIMQAKYNFLKNALDIRMQGINNSDMLMSEINRRTPIEPLMNDDRFIRELSNDEVTYIDKDVSNQLNNYALTKTVVNLRDMCDQYIDAGWRDQDNIRDKVRTAVNDLVIEFRHNDANQDTVDNTFDTSRLREGITDVFNKVTSPSYKLVTGMQGLNAILGGGFQKTKAYSFFGVSGDGKTTTLENLVYQLWKYNRGVELQDKTKKPCIIFLTMEDLVPEVVCSLYNIITHGQELEKAESAEEAIQQFEKIGMSFDENSDDNNIKIFIRFKPVHSVTTDYAYKLIDDMAKQGYECICFLQDYLGRINPVEKTNDSYQDLGNAMNELKTVAMTRNIPVITAAQLNREAIKLIEEGRGANQNDLMRKLSRANIGESVKIDQNLDGSIIILRETSPDNKLYMGFKLCKNRYKIYTDKTFIYQPFYENSKGYVEDVYETKPAFRESLMRDPEEMKYPFGDVERIGINKTVNSIRSLNKSNELLSANTAVKHKFSSSRDVKTISLPRENLIEESFIERVKKSKEKKLVEICEIVKEEDKEKLRELYEIKKVL